MALAAERRVDERQGARRPLRRTAALVAALGCAGGLAVGVLSGDRDAAPPIFTVVFEELGVSPVAPGWRSDGRLRRLTSDGGETYDRWTLAGPPDVSYDGSRVLFAGRARETAEGAVWEMRSTGRGARALFACARGCAAPRYLPGSRLVFAAPVGGEDGSEALYATARDGSRPDRITYGRSRDRAVAVLPDGRIAFVRQPIDARGAPSGPPLLLTVQPDGTGLALAASPLPSELAAAQRTWIPAAPLPGDAPELAGPVLHAVYPAHAPRVGAEPPAMPTRVVAAPRRQPPVATSVVDASRETGWLLCLDAWLTAREGRPFRRPERGGSLRVTDAESGTMLGEVPFAADGSFYVEVPANRLLQLQALDANGSIVAALESGIWVRPNEHRGCIGCHEPRSLAPANQYPEALRVGPARALGARVESSVARIGARSGRE
jgi:hypothetical protein